MLITYLPPIKETCSEEDYSPLNDENVKTMYSYVANNVYSTPFRKMKKYRKNTRVV